MRWQPLCLLVVTAACAAAEPGSLAGTAWRTETIHLCDGRRLQGLVLDPASDSDAPPPTAIGFVQVVQAPGKPTELITWPPISAARIAAVDRLPPEDRAVLADRVERLRSRRGRQHDAETAVALSRSTEDGPWRYEGRWFCLESTADPRLTREAVVRLELVCAAFEVLVPAISPALETSKPATFAVRLCGTAVEYRDLRDREAVEVEHPAFYLPACRLLVAGSDLPALIDQERVAADALMLAEREVAARDRAFAEDVRRLAGDLEQQGVAAAARAETVQLARHRWQREREEMLTRIGAARRENAGRLAAARREFFARLTHEAWHAHADLRLRREGGGSLPLWLDEGLAQVFETAPLDAGELRLDAPDPLRLKALKELLSSPEAVSLATVIEAGQPQFLVGHRGGREESRRAYLMAWGLAFHLAVLEPVLAPATLADLCETSAPSSGRSPATAGDTASRLRQFERLVGGPLADFEPAWRRRMLGLPGGAVTTAER